MRQGDSFEASFCLFFLKKKLYEAKASGSQLKQTV